MEKLDVGDIATPFPVERVTSLHGDRDDAPNADERSRWSAVLARSSDEIDLREILRTIWRRKKVLVATVVLITTMAVLVVLQLTPKYTAKALVMIGDRKTQVVDIEDVLSGLSSDATTVQSEVEVIRSRSIARRVIEELELVKDPEFNAELRKESPLRGLLKPENFMPEDWLVALRGKKEEPPQSLDEVASLSKAHIIEEFLDHVHVSVLTRSRVIRVTFESEQPRKAARIVNTIADQYLNDQLEAKFAAYQRATAWLKEKITDLRTMLEQSEGAVEDYRAENNLVRGQSANTTVERLSEVNSELVLAKSQTAEALARLRQMVSLVESGNGVESAAEVLQSRLIQQLREQESIVERRASEFASQYGERHPRLINIRAEIVGIRANIEKEMRKIIQGLSNEVSVARAREASLFASVKELESQAMTENQLEIKLRQLERDAEANHLLYETLVARFKETSDQEGIQEPDARIISRADVPVLPSFPNTTLSVGLAGTASIFLGMLLVFLLERLDSGVRTPEEIEQLTGISALGIVPQAPTLTRRRQMGSFVLDKPSSGIAEAIRSLRTVLLLSDLDHPPKSVCVTSSLPGEGKTTVAVWLARLAAISGEQVLLIDCDFRRPAVHNTLQIGNDVGLVGLLTGKHSLEEVITIDKASGAHVITTEAVNKTQLGLIGSDKLKRVIGKFRDEYDLVVIDSPPLLVVSDAKRLSRIVDKTIYLAKWESTPRATILAGLKQLLDIGANLAGIVLTQVNMRKHAGFGYGAAGYYYGRYKNYYPE